MKNILVTGGAGFIGSHTVVELAHEGYNPVIVDNFSNSTRSVLKGLEKIIGWKPLCYKGHYQNKNLLNRIFRDNQIEGIIHFAAYKAVGESVEKPLAYYNNNVAGLIQLLEAMEDNEIPHLVFSSSCTVYGEPDKLPITEDSPKKPAASPYGATKQICEMVIEHTPAASKNLRALSLRYFNPIGAHQSSLIGELPLGVPSNLIPFLTQAAAGIRSKLTVHGRDYPTPDGTCIRDYIHVVDLAKAHVKALEHLVKQLAGYYEAFNIGSGRGHSVLEIIRAFEEKTGKKVPYTFGPRRAGDVVSVYAGVDKAKEKLGWRAEKSIEDALEDAWEWQKRFIKS